MAAFDAGIDHDDIDLQVASVAIDISGGVLGAVDAIHARG